MKLRKGQRKVKTVGYLRFAVLEGHYPMALEVLPISHMMELIEDDPNHTGTPVYAADDGTGQVWFYPLPDRGCSIRLRVVVEQEL